MMRMVLATATLILGGFFPVGLQAQTGSATPRAAVEDDKPKEEPGSQADPREEKKTPAPALKRWIDWQIGAVESRYRWVETSAGDETSNSLQHKQTFKAGLKLDRQGRYSIQALAGTGSSFVGSWDNLGPGIGEPAWTFNLRQLYLQARPAARVEASWGGMALNRGEHTEITTFDNDNYVMAGRLSVKRPESLYFDEISVSAGYLGDLNTPNVIKRFDRWDEHNYTQVLVGKKFGKVVSLSADWTDLDEITTLRQAVRVTTRQWTSIIDGLRFENYQRVEGNEGYGFALSVDKAVHPKVVLAGGYADIDRNNGTLTGDRYFRGKRVFAEPRIQILPELTLSFFYTEAFDNDFAVPNEHRFDIVLQYNVLKAMQKFGAW
jgi:hypothetical protein